MDPESQTRVLCSLAGALADEGCLVLGSGEEAAAAGETFSPVAGHAGIFRVNPAMRAAAA
jgi:chemotaxis methyl-accepting protein methylase